MKIYLHEITNLETELDFTEDEKWTVDAVRRVDENPAEDSHSLKPSGLTRTPRTDPRSIRAHFSLRKVDEVVVASGDIKTHVRLVCSRCANEFQLDLAPHFSALFCKDPVMAGVAHLQGPGKPAGQHNGFARHAHDQGHDALMAAGKDLDITYLSEDYIDLKELMMEQLQLQIPFQPLCREDCKGICVHCGADLNVGRCACAKMIKESPFSVLKNLKL